MLDPSPDWAERKRRMNIVRDAAVASMKRALAGDLTPDVFAQIKADVEASVTDEVRAEMLLYTSSIDVDVRGKTHYSGWWRWKKVSRKYIHVDVIFSPYRMGLSAWTDPTRPGGVVLFE